MSILYFFLSCSLWSFSRLRIPTFGNSPWAAFMHCYRFKYYAILIRGSHFSLKEAEEKCVVVLWVLEQHRPSGLATNHMADPLAPAPLAHLSLSWT